MSFYRFLSEITAGTWLIAPENIPQYQQIARTILSGGFVNEVKPELSTIIGKEVSNSRGESILQDQVGVVEMIGAMTKYSGPCNIGAIEIAGEMLRLDANSNVQAHVIVFDGPGGNADAMPVFHELKKKLTKCVVGYVEKADSLHLWAALVLCDKIVIANNLTAEMGSVGVLVAFDKSAKEVIYVRPPESQDKIQEYISAFEGDTSLLEEKLSPLAKHFQNGVKSTRPNVPDEALHGKTYVGKEAIKIGFADVMGDMQKAYNMAITLSKLQPLK